MKISLALLISVFTITVHAGSPVYDPYLGPDTTVQVVQPHKKHGFGMALVHGAGLVLQGTGQAAQVQDVTCTTVKVGNFVQMECR